MRKVKWLAWLVSLPFVGISQSKMDSAILSSAHAYSKNAYYQSRHLELGLYNGIYYKEYVLHQNDEGQPYFETDQWVEGELFYNGVHYENIPLLYDVVNDKIIIDHSVKLELISEKIKYFVIQEHRFVLLTANANSPIHTGFFELVYDGQSKLYAKWQKKRIEVIASRELQVRYEDQNRIYINKDGKFHSVKTKSSVLHVLEDKKIMLKKYIKKNQLNFRGHRAESIAKIMAFYESGAE